MADDKLIFDILTGQNTLSKDLNSVKTSVASVEKNIGGLKNSFSGASKAASGIGAAFSALTGPVGIALVAIGSVVATLNKVTSAASEQEDAVNRLNIALKASGDFSEEATKELQDYASELQKVSRVGDEVTLSNLALLKSLAPLTNEGLKQANTAAVNLSSALRIDLDTAVRLIGKAANGNVEAFKKFGVELVKGKNDAETFANALAALNTRFGSAAAKDILTFSGAVAQSKNAFGDIIEEIGLTIIQSPLLISNIKAATASFSEFAESIKVNAPALTSFFESILKTGSSLIRFGSELALAIVTIKKLSDAFFIASSVVSLLKTNLSLLQARTGITFFQAITADVIKLIAAVKSLNLALVATRISLTLLKAVGTLGLTVAFDLALQKIIELKEEAGSFASIFSNAFLSVKKTVNEALFSISDNIAGIFEAISSVPGSSDAFKNIGKSFREFADEAKKSITDAELISKKIAKNAEETKEGYRSISNIKPAQLLKSGAGDLEEFNKTSKEVIKKLEDGFKNVGQTQFEIIARETGERAVQIQKYVKDRKKADELISLNAKKAIEDVAKAQKDVDDKRQKDLQEKIQIAAQTPFNLAFKDIEGIEIGDDIAQGIAAGLGSISSIFKGASGAADLISGAAGGLANAIAPGLGAVVSDVFSKLSAGPEAVKGFIDSFIQGVPLIIENIILAIPQIIQSFAENAGPLIQKLFEIIPEAINRFIERLPEVAVALINGAIKAGITFATQMPFIATKLAISFAAQAPMMAISFVNELIKETPRLISEMIKQLGQSVGGIFGGSSGGGGFGDTLKTAATFGLSDIFGFADGGIVPGGAPFSDRVPALLTPGEQVIDRSLTEKLDRFLSSGNTGQAQNLTVNISVGEEQLARVLLNLNRNGFRTA